ncbi:hypothetical protein [Pseudomonas sp. NA-150]|uniref:hypothetical protein n=1 Tax=Pseudomonas sp. NA-150 TaxID=3367525 RepID=UPI0037C7BEE8
MTKLSGNETQDVDDKEHVRPVLEGKTLMRWTIKAHPHPMHLVDITMGVATLLPISLIVYGYFFQPLGDNDDSLVYTGVIVLCCCLFLWIRGARQKTVFNYRITDQGGEVESWPDYPENMGAFFKWLSGISLFVVVCLIAVDPAFVWGLAGPVGIAIGGAKFFLGWEIEKKFEAYPYWHSCNFVTVDRKRRMIIAHQTRLDVGFDVHLSKELFDVYLNTLKAVLPSTAVFTEAPWKW